MCLIGQEFWQLLKYARNTYLFQQGTYFFEVILKSYVGIAHLTAWTNHNAQNEPTFNKTKEYFDVKQSQLKKKTEQNINEHPIKLRNNAYFSNSKWYA